MGDLCAQYLFHSLAQFEAAVCVPGHPMQALLTFVLSVRRNPRTRRTLHAVNVLVTSGARWPRWLHTLLCSAFTLYCTLRREAVPRARQPVLTDSLEVDIPIRVVRELQRHGIRWMTERHRFSLKALG